MPNVLRRGRIGADGWVSLVNRSPRVIALAVIATCWNRGANHSHVGCRTSAISRLRRCSFALMLSQCRQVLGRLTRHRTSTPMSPLPALALVQMGTALQKGYSSPPIQISHPYHRSPARGGTSEMRCEACRFRVPRLRATSNDKPGR